MLVIAASVRFRDGGNGRLVGLVLGVSGADLFVRLVNARLVISAATAEFLLVQPLAHDVVEFDGDVEVVLVVALGWGLGRV